MAAEGFFDSLMYGSRPPFAEDGFVHTVRSPVQTGTYLVQHGVCRLEKRRIGGTTFRRSIKIVLK